MTAPTHGSSEQLLNAYRITNKVLKRLALGTSLDALFKDLITITESVCEGRLSSILLLNEDNKLVKCCAPNLPTFYAEAVNHVDIGPNVGSCGAAAYLKQAVIVEDIAQHPNWLPFRELAMQAELAACWSVPILSSHDCVLGTFAIYSQRVEAPGRDEMEILELAASVAAVAIEKHQTEDKLTYMASHDALTGVTNRHAFTEQLSRLLAHAERAMSSLALFFIDLNKFKQINDTYGHSVGDQALIAIVRQLSKATREMDLLGRWGGDEFMLACPIQNEHELAAIKQRINQALDIELHTAQGQTRVTASLGVAVCKPEYGYDLQKAVHDADLNMYQAKLHSRRA